MKPKYLGFPACSALQVAELHSVLHVFPEQWKTIPYVNEDINLPMLGKHTHTQELCTTRQLQTL